MMWWNTFYNKFHSNETVVMAKYAILIWASSHNWETQPFGKGQEELFKQNCDFKNCYFTNDTHFFGNSLKGFDAIIFNGIRTPFGKHFKNLPKQRHYHQKYVFFSSEPADYYPLCSKSFNNFFNWTYTYKLNSDCVIRYLRIKNKNGKIIYPERSMRWVNNYTNEVSKSFKDRLKSKKIAAAWFVSRCHARSNRHSAYFQLRKELLRYNLKIDVYGKCGNLKCSNTFDYRSCYEMLERDYYFYLAFENSICEDYVTEKVLHALLNKVVPIVYGGANYSWFLPPGSYIDLRSQSIQKIALTMKNAISDPNLYASFFKWTNYYSYLNNGSGVANGDYSISICDFCKLMNDKDKLEHHSSYQDMRRWWHPGYKKRCKKYRG